MRRWSFSHPLKMVKRDSHGKGWSAKLYDKAASAPRVSLPKYNQILSQVFWNRIGVLCPITCQYQWGLKRDPWFFFGCVVCQLSERERKKTCSVWCWGLYFYLSRGTNETVPSFNLGHRFRQSYQCSTIHHLNPVKKINIMMGQKVFT